MDDDGDVRAATLADLPAMLALYAQLNACDRAADAATAGSAWSEMLATPGMTVLVRALADGRLVATWTLIILPNLTRSARPWAIIENVVSDAAHRGRGHGRAVLQVAIQAARQAGCYKLSLATGRTDEATLHFYDRVGLTRGGKTHFEVRWS